MTAHQQPVIDTLRLPRWLESWRDKVFHAIKIHDQLPNRERAWQHCKSGHPETVPSRSDMWAEAINDIGTHGARKLFGEFRPKLATSAREFDHAMAIMDRMTLLDKDDRSLLFCLAKGRPVWKLARRFRTTPERLHMRYERALRTLAFNAVD